MTRSLHPNEIECEECKGVGFINGKNCLYCCGGGTICEVCNKAFSECSGIHNRTDTSH